ncbi:hypothetical protein E2C01_078663 [Portunus trituberculatus]|uniref:Uncharacterized protein n=1 Tax=Portunus trituberculatus TaxID=210409 RepID=A0A5B7IHH1_PORTR|nr:hypothetical protein [Portunus trituberculatus]
MYIYEYCDGTPTYWRQRTYTFARKHHSKLVMTSEAIHRVWRGEEPSSLSGQQDKIRGCDAMYKAW